MKREGLGPDLVSRRVLVKSSLARFNPPDLGISPCTTNRFHSNFHRYHRSRHLTHILLFGHACRRVLPTFVGRSFWSLVMRLRLRGSICG